MFVGVAPLFRAAVAPVFAVGMAAVFDAAFGVLSVAVYADTEQAEKVKAAAMMKIDFITFAPISSGNNLTLQSRGLSAKFDAARSRLSERSRDVPGSGN
jgi:hypothetical protein